MHNELGNVRHVEPCHEARLTYLLLPARQWVDPFPRHTDSLQPLALVFQNHDP